MATAVFYIDESGTSEPFSLPLQNGVTPIFTLTAVVLPLSRWRDFDRKYNNLKERFFPDETQKKGRKEDVEIKGNDLTCPRNKDSERRQAFLKQVFRLLKDFNASIFAVTFVKSADNHASAKSLYTKGFQILLERFNDYLESSEERSERFDDGIIICDSRAGAIKGRGLDKDIAKSYQTYIFGNEKGRQFTRLQETPLFADSKITVGLQLVDIVSSVIYANHYAYHMRGIENAPDYSHTRKWWKCIQELEYVRSMPNKSAYPIYGIRVVNHQNSRDI